MNKDNTPIVTRQSDGNPPTYEELEIAYYTERSKRESLEEAFKQSQDNSASLRLQIKRLTNVNKKLEEVTS